MSSSLRTLETYTVVHHVLPGRGAPPMGQGL
jgi:hypothetical protein